jgi:parvulin-like peptidyl-prolyl isomerase
VMQKLSVTEDEARAYYEANRQQFTTPASLTLREIHVNVPTSAEGVNVAADDEVRAKVEAVRKRAMAGEPFARLAGEVSDAASKANGGLIGPFSYEDLAPALRTTIEKMAVGDVTDVMRTPRGYQILKLESRTDAVVRTFEEARNDISNRVAEQKSRQEMARYIERLRAQATIQFKNAELEKAYQQALDERRKAAGLAPVS